MYCQYVRPQLDSETDSVQSLRGKTRLVRLLSRGAQIGSAADYLPEGRRLVIGENSSLKL
jgi:hypothetical protein